MSASKLLAGGLLLGIGLVTGGATLSAAAAGVGVNWVGEGAAGLWTRLAAAPEDALRRAYAAAIRDGVADLQTRYRNQVDSRADPAAFKLVAACAEDVAAAGIAREFPAGAADIAVVQRSLAGALAALLHGHDERQVAFLRRELLPACAAAFQRHLLKDDAAWRDFHGGILQGLAAGFADLSVHVDRFGALLAAWSDPSAIFNHLRRLEAQIEALARRPAAAPVFDNRGLIVGGNVYQADGDQYNFSAHAKEGSIATVINNIGGPPASSTTAAGGDGPAVALFLAANPLETDRLRLDQEARRIETSLRQGGRSLQLAHAWAVRGDDLLDALLHHRPQIVHFAGHGDDDCLILEGADGHAAVLGAEAVAALLEASRGVRCVVLNACWSDSMAARLIEVVPCVVGMETAVGDAAAVSFAAGFYRVLAAGESVATAMAGGQAQVLAERLPAALTARVRLRTAAGVNASALRFGVS